MGSRYGLLALYSLLVATAAGVWLAHDLTGLSQFPPMVGRGALHRRVSLRLAVRAQRAACGAHLHGAAAADRRTADLRSGRRRGSVRPPRFLWPFFNRGYSYRSIKVAAIRALHNAGMTALMLLLAGEAYRAAGGRHPLGSPPGAGRLASRGDGACGTERQHRRDVAFLLVRRPGRPAARSSRSTPSSTCCSCRPAYWRRCSTTPTRSAPSRCLPRSWCSSC